MHLEMLRDQLIGWEVVWGLVVLSGTVRGGALDRCGGWHGGAAAGVQPPGGAPELPDSLARNHRQG